MSLNVFYVHGIQRVFSPYSSHKLLWHIFLHYFHNNIVTTGPECVNSQHAALLSIEQVS